MASHEVAVRPAVAGRDWRVWIPACLLAGAWLGPTASLLLRKALAAPEIGLQVLVLAPQAGLLLMGIALSRGRGAAALSADQVLPYAFLLIALAAVAGAAVANPDQEVLLRTAYIIFVFGTFGFVGNVLEPSVIKTALIITGIAEALQPLFLLDAWNRNAAASHFSLAVLCSAGWARGWRGRAGVGLLVIVGAAAFGSRTATLSQIAALAALGGVRIRTKGGRLFVGVALVMVIGGTASDSGRQWIAEATARIDSPIASFITKNKGERFLDDPLNRRGVWDAALAGIRENGLWGVGAGQEGSVTGTFRAHSTYLSLALQYGVVGALAWVSFYVSGIRRFATILRQTRDPVASTGFLLGIYLLTAGLTESTGMGSLASPTNLVLATLALSPAPAIRARQGRHGKDDRRRCRQASGSGRLEAMGWGR